MSFSFDTSKAQAAATTAATAPTSTFTFGSMGAGDAGKSAVLPAALPITGTPTFGLRNTTTAATTATTISAFGAKPLTSGLTLGAGEATSTAPTTGLTFGTPNTKAAGTGFATGTTATGFATGTPATGFGTGTPATGFGTGTPASGFGIGTPATGFATGTTATGFATGTPATGFATGTTATGFAPGTTATGFTTGTPATGFAIGTTATGFPTGTTATGFSTGTPATGFATGTTATGFATGTTATGFSTTANRPTSTATGFSFGTGTTATTSTTGFSLNKTSTAPSLTTPSTQLFLGTTTTVTPSANANQPASISSFEESINKWTLELEEQEKVFVNQAAQVNAWDKLLITNGEKIVALNEEVERVKIEQQQLEQELDYVVGQQKELQDCLEPLEKDLKSLSVSDPEREYTYRLAEDLDTQLKRMSEDLKEIIEHLNQANRTQDSSDPIVQIGKILNAHMNSLQWLDQQTTLLNHKIQQIDQMHQNFRQENERSFNLAYN